MDSIKSKEIGVKNFMSTNTNKKDRLNDFEAGMMYGFIKIIEIGLQIIFDKQKPLTKKQLEKRICRHGNFIFEGKCNCLTCKKGIDY